MKEIIIWKYGVVTQVDDIDFLFTLGLGLTLTDGYVNTYNPKDGSSALLHRLIARRAGLDVSKQIDHRDRVRLNNQRFNLRAATHAQNMQNCSLRRTNISGFKGVCFDRRDQKWRASIRISGSQRSLGYFDTPEEASEAYQRAAKLHHGEFA